MKRSLLLVLSLFLLLPMACQDSFLEEMDKDVEEKVKPSPYEIGNFIPTEDAQFLAHIDAFFGSSRAKGGKAKMPNIDWKKGKKAKNNKTGVVHYTVGLENAFLQYFIVRETPEQPLEAYYLQFTPAENGLAFKEDGLLNWSAFSGTMTRTDLEGKLLGTATLEKGQEKNAKGRSYCTWEILELGNESTGTGTSTGTGYTLYLDCWDEAGDLSEEIVSPSYGYDPIAAEDPTSGGSKIALLEEKKADYWEKMYVKQTDAFKNDPCMQKAFLAIAASNSLHNAISGFFGEASNYTITFDVVNSLLGSDGQQINGNTTSPDANGNIIIRINKKHALGRSPLIIARTMIHEAIHAELFRQVAILKKNPALQPVCPESGTNFEHLWCYYTYYKAINGDWQHEYMADFYVDVIAKELEKLNITLSTQGWIKYVAGDAAWSWNDYFTYIAWEGLQKTDEFKDRNSANPDFLQRYDYYKNQYMYETNKCN